MNKEFIGGVSTDVYHYPALVDTASVKGNLIHVILIPGNPGPLWFYLNFLETLGKTLNSAVARTKSDDFYCVHGFGHAFHHLRDLSDERDFAESKKHSGPAFGLDDQIRHALCFLRSVIRRNDLNCKIVLIGHSIGSFIALSILRAHPAEICSRTIQLVHLMPFIRWTNIPLSHRMKLIAYSKCDTLANSIIRMLFKRFERMTLLSRESLLKQAGFDASATTDILPSLAGRLLSERLLYNFASMGKDEIERVPLQQEAMMTTLKQLDGLCKQLIIITSDDEWCPEEDVEIYKRTLVHTRTLFVPNLTHSFTFSLEGTTMVASLVMEFVVGSHSSQHRSVNSVSQMNSKL